MTNPEHLATRIAKFRDERRALQEMVVACFPIDSEVRNTTTRQVGRVRCTVHGFCDLLMIEYQLGTVAQDVTKLERVA